MVLIAESFFSARLRSSELSPGDTGTPVTMATRRHHASTTLCSRLKLNPSTEIQKVPEDHHHDRLGPLWVPLVASSVCSHTGFWPVFPVAWQRSEMACIQEVTDTGPLKSSEYGGLVKPTDDFNDGKKKNASFINWFFNNSFLVASSSI